MTTVRRARIPLPDHGPLHGEASSPAVSMATGSLLTAAGVLLLALASGPLGRALGHDGAAALVAWGVGLVPLLAGIWLAARGASSSRAASARTKLAERYPLEPWLWDHAWDHVRVLELGAPSTASLLARTVLASLLVLAAAAAATGLLLAGITRGVAAMPILAAGTTVILALALAGCVASARSALARLRGESAELTFSSFPFLLGETLRAELRLPVRGVRLSSVELTLRLVEEERFVHEGSGGTRANVFAQQLYSERRLIDERGLLAQVGSGMPVEFPLPADLPGTSLSGPSRTYWELSANVTNGQLESDHRFLIPVYSTAPSGVRSSLSTRVVREHSPRPAEPAAITTGPEPVRGGSPHEPPAVVGSGAPAKGSGSGESAPGKDEERQLVLVGSVEASDTND